MGIQTTTDNCRTATWGDLLVLAVQPGQVRAVLAEIKPALRQETIVISVITGFAIQSIKEVIGDNHVVFRAMPNTAIAIQESMTCVATDKASPVQVQAVMELFEALGKAVIIDENLIASSTVLGACGIAYAMRFIRAASQGGTEIGFDAEIAQLIAAQTVKGAASLLIQNHSHPEREIDKVTTPRGCTIAGLNEMEHQGFSSSLIKGITTSYQRISVIKDEN
jgi:pyrroline-5-carboxylate reductase